MITHLLVWFFNSTYNFPSSSHQQQSQKDGAILLSNAGYWQVKTSIFTLDNPFDFNNLASMKDRENYKIDESIKLISWGTNFQQNGHQEQTRELFEKYSKGQPAVPYDPTEELNQIATEESQVKNIQTGFRKLKNEQIERLKDLRTEFEEIRKGNPQHIAPRTSRTPSMHSSSNSSLEPVLTPQPSKSKTTGSRELQILELQKKQLETMLQNSMKKIEQLLQNEMQFKKTIHELKLQRDTRPDIDGEGSARQYRKKEKENSEQIRVMELQREHLLSSINSYKEKVKYLESSLASCEKELKKILDQKRNYEELIRVEKDKFMNLEIEFRRQKRQHEIMQKDKNAEINRLMKMKDIKEGSIEKEMKNTISALQQEVKTKDKRYVLLLEQFQNAQKKMDKQEKQQEVKIVTEILTKTAPDAQGKAFQETISSILTRLTDLEKKPIVEIDKFIPHFDRQEDNQQVFIQLEQRISELQSKIQANLQENRILTNSNYELQEKKEQLERENERLRENEVDLKAEIEKIKKQRLRKDRSQMQLIEQRTKSEPVFEGVAFSEQIKDLESQLNYERRQKASLSAQYEFLSNQNRQLRLKISKLEFEVEKAAKEAKFQSELQAKSYQSEIQYLNRDLKELKQAINQNNASTATLKQEYQQTLEAKTAQISNLKDLVQTLQKQKQNIDEQTKEIFNQQLHTIREGHNSQIGELTSKIQFLTLQNSKFQDENKMIVSIERENEQLRQHLRSMRSINASTDQLWLQKEKEYQKVDQIMTCLTRP